MTAVRRLRGAPVPDPVPPPVDPDVDLHLARDRAELRRHPALVLGAISAGGVIGALARHGVQAVLPHRPAAFGWATFAVNVAGCLLIGVLMVLVTRVWAGRPLLRPFLGVGVLGGFTTFSTYVVDAQQAVRAGAVPTALVYLAGTVASALVAVWAGTALTAWLVARAPSRARGAVPAPGHRAGGGAR